MKLASNQIVWAQKKEKWVPGIIINPMDEWSNVEKIGEEEHNVYLLGTGGVSAVKKGNLKNFCSDFVDCFDSSDMEPDILEAVEVAVQLAAKNAQIDIPADDDLIDWAGRNIANIPSVFITEVFYKALMVKQAETEGPQVKGDTSSTSNSKKKNRKKRKVKNKEDRNSQYISKQLEECSNTSKKKPEEKIEIPEKARNGAESSGATAPQRKSIISGLSFYQVTWARLDGKWTLSYLVDPEDGWDNLEPKRKGEHYVAKLPDMTIYTVTETDIRDFRCFKECFDSENSDPAYLISVKDMVKSAAAQVNLKAPDRDWAAWAKRNMQKTRAIRIAPKSRKPLFRDQVVWVRSEGKWTASVVIDPQEGWSNLEPKRKGQHYVARIRDTDVSQVEEIDIKDFRCFKDCFDNENHDHEYLSLVKSIVKSAASIWDLKVPDNDWVAWAKTNVPSFKPFVYPIARIPFRNRVIWARYEDELMPAIRIDPRDGWSCLEPKREGEQYVAWVRDMSISQVKEENMKDFRCLKECFDQNNPDPSYKAVVQSIVQKSAALSRMKVPFENWIDWAKINISSFKPIVIEEHYVSEMVKKNKEKGLMKMRGRRKATRERTQFSIRTEADSLVLELENEIGTPVLTLGKGESKKVVDDAADSKNMTCAEKTAESPIKTKEPVYQAKSVGPSGSRNRMGNPTATTAESVPDKNEGDKKENSEDVSALLLPLEKGWVRARKNGNTDGGGYIVYWAPATRGNTRLRSNPDVKKYLGRVPQHRRNGLTIANFSFDRNVILDHANQRNFDKE